MFCCEACNYSTNRKFAFYKHIKTKKHESKVKRKTNNVFRCNNCKNFFNAEDEYFEHIEFHLAESKKSKNTVIINYQIKQIKDYESENLNLNEENLKIKENYENLKIEFNNFGLINSNLKYELLQKDKQINEQIKEIDFLRINHIVNEKKIEKRDEEIRSIRKELNEVRIQKDKLNKQYLETISKDNDKLKKEKAKSVIFKNCNFIINNNKAKSFIKIDPKKIMDDYKKIKNIESCNKTIPNIDYFKQKLPLKEIKNKYINNRIKNFSSSILDFYKKKDINKQSIFTIDLEPFDAEFNKKCVYFLKKIDNTETSDYPGWMLDFDHNHVKNDIVTPVLEYAKHNIIVYQDIFNKENFTTGMTDRKLKICDYYLEAIQDGTMSDGILKILAKQLRLDGFQSKINNKSIKEMKKGETSKESSYDESSDDESSNDESSYNESSDDESSDDESSNDEYNNDDSSDVSF